MRLPHPVLALLCLIASATIGTPVAAAAPTRKADHAMHTTHACLSRHIIMRTAWHGTAPSDAAAVRCMGGAARIGAGYTRLLSTSALQRPHHRIRT